ILLRLETERSGHAAASRRHDLDLEAEALQELPLGRGIEDGMVVAMNLHQRAPAAEIRQCRVAALLREEFAQEEALLLQALRPLVIGKEPHGFVAEGGDAGGLEADHRHAALQSRLERVE